MTEQEATRERIYIDTNALIDFVEARDTRQKAVADVILKAIRGGSLLYMSDVGMAECLYGAYRANSAALEAAYREIFDELGLIRRIPVDSTRVLEAARLGVDKGLKLIDAVHYLAAIEARCTLLLTNDRDFKSSHGIYVRSPDVPM